MNLDHLLHAVDHGSVIRYSLQLSTSSADGLVCPPTYAPSKRGDPPYIAFRKAYVGGVVKEVVVLDSPQSQSNRVETALLAAHRAGRLAYPDIEIRFPSQPAEPVYSVLQLSHRIFDAVLRACTLAGVPFFETDVGQALLASRAESAQALFRHAPVALVLGAWDSNGGAGPLAAKLPRLLTSEIIGLDASPADLSATKFDPMDIRSNVAELLPASGATRRFEIKGASSAKAGREKGKKPSEFGYGSVPATAAPRAAVISEALQTSVLSCSGLRNLAFPDNNGSTDAPRDRAGRAVLAALALYGLVAQNEAGYRLRSRCELLPRDDGRFEVIGRTLSQKEDFSLNVDTAAALMSKACEHAAAHGLSFREDVLRLEADDRLQELVRRSREAAAREDSESEA